MSRYHRVWVVYRKELIDTLRDRRTLIAMILVPIVLYPVLMLVLIEALRSEKGRREAVRYTIVVPDHAHRDWLAGVFHREQADLSRTASMPPPSSTSPAAATEAKPPELRAQVSPDQIEIVVRPGESLWDLINRREAHLGILISPPPTGREAPAINRVVQLIYRDTEPLSEFICHQLVEILSHESERIIDQRLADVPGGKSLIEPFKLNELSTAGPEQQFSKILSMMVPFLLVIMTVTGAMYPAIDLTAGERERGTLETLAVSPVPTGQIVAGKFGVVVTIALFSTALNLASMSAMVRFTKLDRLVGAAQSAEEVSAVEEMIAAQPASAPAGGYSQRDYLEMRRKLEATSGRQAGFLITAAPIVMFAMLPFAVLFSGIMIAACSCARTFKEAQNYMMPVMMAALVPAMVVSYMPSVRLEGVLTVVPVANVVVLIRELFLGNHAWGPMALAIGSTAFYAVVAVAIAARLYGNEAVLFSDVGSYKTLLMRRFIRPAPRPSAAAALLLLAIIFPINFYWQSAMLDENATSGRALGVLAAAQVFIIGGPAIFLAWYLKLDWRETFSLRPGTATGWIGAGMVAVSEAPVASLLFEVQRRWFTTSNESTRELTRMFDTFLGGASPWTVLLALAVLPAVCEELLFRGTLLAGLRGRMGDVKTAVFIGVLFGLFHVFVEKIPIVALMGTVLAWVCLRSGSILPAMLIHVCNNGVPVLMARAGDLPGWLGRGLEVVYGGASNSGGESLIDTRAAVFAGLFVAGIAVASWRNAKA